jgi:hypothetical protein
MGLASRKPPPVAVNLPKQGCRRSAYDQAAPAHKGFQDGAFRSDPVTGPISDEGLTGLSPYQTVSGAFPPACE